MYNHVHEYKYNYAYAYKDYVLVYIFSGIDTEVGITDSLIDII